MAKRPTTCSEYVTSNPDKGEGRVKGCKRLPNHGGECRPFLTLAAQRRAERVTPEAKPKKAAVKGRAATQAQIKAAIKAARLTVGQPAGRLSVTTRRKVVAEIMAMLDAGSINQSIALGAVASL